MHMNRKPSPALVASLFLLVPVLCLTAIPSCGQQSARGRAAETATLQLLRLHQNYQQASAAEQSQLLTQFQTIAAQRQQLLLSLMQSNPGDVLRIAIPDNVSRTMPPTVKGYLEQSVTAQGALEVLYEMQGTPNATTGTVLHHFLQTSTEHLALHFAA